jgi:Mrp family chromosome partitioning ATPase
MERKHARSEFTMAEGIDFAERIAEDKAIRSHMDKIGRKILVMSGKGGVGKTTVTINLANALVDSGCTVGILDTDLHGPNVAKMLGCENGILETDDGGKSFFPVEARPGLKVMSLAFAIPDRDAPIVWRGPMKMAAIRQFLAQADWGTLDYLLIDSPPGTGDEQLTVCQSIPELTGTVIVTTPQEVAILDARRSVNFSRKLNVAILGVVENMSGLICPHCNEEIPLFGIGGGKKMAEEMQVPFLGRIPIEVPLREAEDAGTSFLQVQPGSASSTALKDIARTINAGTACSTSRSTDFAGTEACDGSSCAGCTSGSCSSRKDG